MKRIAYVSQISIGERGINLPIGISDIIKASREFNSNAQITGNISYRKEHYFQILEGPQQQVDSLMIRFRALKNAPALFNSRRVFYQVTIYNL